MVSKQKLPKVFKKKWVNALRSGKYIQGEGQLYDPDTKTYCCLGVACAIQGIDNEKLIDFGTIPSDIVSEEIPKMLVGTIETNPTVKKLVNFNDGNGGAGKSFKWIASYIERFL